MSLKAQIQIGELRDRVGIKQPTPTQTASGSIENSWATLATVWAKVEETSGQEAERGDRETAFTKTVFTVRHDSNTSQIKKTWKLEFKSNLYEVTAILRVGNIDRFLKIETLLKE